MADSWSPWLIPLGGVFEVKACAGPFQLPRPFGSDEFHSGPRRLGREVSPLGQGMDNSILPWHLAHLVSCVLVFKKLYVCETNCFKVNDFFLLIIGCVV